jgi:hypothetical protein
MVVDFELSEKMSTVLNMVQAFIDAEVIGTGARPLSG